MFVLTYQSDFKKKNTFEEEKNLNAHFIKFDHFFLRELFAELVNVKVEKGLIINQNMINVFSDNLLYDIIKLLTDNLTKESNNQSHISIQSCVIISFINIMHTVDTRSEASEETKEKFNKIIHDSHDRKLKLLGNICCYISNSEWLENCNESNLGQVKYFIKLLSTKDLNNCEARILKKTLEDVSKVLTNNNDNGNNTDQYRALKLYLLSCFLKIEVEKKNDAIHMANLIVNTMLESIKTLLFSPNEGHKKYKVDSDYSSLFSSLNDFIKAFEIKIDKPNPTLVRAINQHIRDITKKIGVDNQGLGHLIKELNFTQIKSSDTTFDQTFNDNPLFTKELLIISEYLFSDLFNFKKFMIRDCEGNIKGYIKESEDSKSLSFCEFKKKNKEILLQKVKNFLFKEIQTLQSCVHFVKPNRNSIKKFDAAIGDLNNALSEINLELSLVNEKKEQAAQQENQKNIPRESLQLCGVNNDAYNKSRSSFNSSESISSINNTGSTDPLMPGTQKPKSQFDLIKEVFKKISLKAKGAKQE